MNLDDLMKQMKNFEGVAPLAMDGNGHAPFDPKPLDLVKQTMQMAVSGDLTAGLPPKPRKMLAIPVPTGKGRQ